MARGPVDFPGEAPYTTFHPTNHTKEVGRRGGPLEKARGGFAQALRAAFPVTVPVLTGFLCLGVT